MGLFRLINKDTAFENESRQGVVTLRLLYIIQVITLSLNVFYAGLPVLSGFKYRIIAAAFVMVCLFVLTYHLKTQPSMICYVLFTFMMIPALIPCFGWKAGMQDYYVIVLMLAFIANIGSTGFKFVLAGLVFLSRSAVIVCFGGMDPVIAIDQIGDKLIQVTNNASVFLAVMVISFIFSRKENEAETKLMKYNDKLVREANTDQLTGLYNRRRCMEMLDEIQSANALGSISIVMGDIDFFKKVNDSYGHDAGDEVLKGVADAMREICGREAFISRWGGEEFLLIFAGKNGDETIGITERLRLYIMEHPIKVKGIDISVTMTFGLAEYDFNGDIQSTVKEADSKLYMGKEAGRNRVVY